MKAKVPPFLMNPSKLLLQHQQGKKYTFRRLKKKIQLYHP